MNKIIQFGEIADGHNIPVLNEREIRAACPRPCKLAIVFEDMHLDIQQFIYGTQIATSSAKY